MNSIRVDIRLRPIRFGFLVRPDDAENILEIFRINTCLWGGMFNPIIPLFENIPPWLEKEGFHFDNAKQLIMSDLDFFEPDFIVEAEEGLADGFGFDPKRILQLKDFSGYYGLTVEALYWELYREEFRFEASHRRNVVYVEPADSSWENFVAANFGDFPIQDQTLSVSSTCKDRFRGIFNPEHKKLDPVALSEQYQFRHISALEIGSKKLQIDYNEFQSPVLFILDAQESKDLIDLWNLRAVYSTVVAVPIQWIQPLAGFCEDFIRENSSRHFEDPGAEITGPVFMYSRSLSEDYIEEIHKNFRLVVEENADIVTKHHPPTWRTQPDSWFTNAPPTLVADKNSKWIYIDLENSEIQFDALFPEFAGKYRDRSCLANVVKLEDESNSDQIATVFPYEGTNTTFLKSRLTGHPPKSTTEGLVIFPEYRNLSERWKMVDGTTAINQWLESNQVIASPSDAGRATQQIIETLKGCKSVGCLANKGIIKLLNEMSNRPVTKTAHYKEFQNKVGNAIDNKKWENALFERLVERKVVELGLELKCRKCNNWSWYSITHLDYTLICDFCLKQFDFPITRPSSSNHARWAYRVIGPFALPNYAQGGYAAALAIRFFTDVIGRKNWSAITWSAGQTLELPPSKTVEADFMLWLQRTVFLGPPHPPLDILFGEAKSFGKDAFKQEDVDKMRLLAEVFPGSILVFAAMKEVESFSKEEISCIKELAEWGREFDKEKGKTRAPVIVLTGTELLTLSSLEDLWKEKGGKHEALIESARGRINNPKVLANITQQLYLGMPSYD